MTYTGTAGAKWTRVLVPAGGQPETSWRARGAAQMLRSGKAYMDREFLTLVLFTLTPPPATPPSRIQQIREELCVSRVAGPSYVLGCASSTQVL